ncbi:MAG: protein kinase [Oscillospiraceae bacterium]|nr:protein kinase [Oscillospiraceae bacterium]
MSVCYNCFNKISDSNEVCPQCGYNPEADRGKYPMALPGGTILAGQYIVGRVLGQGGFGITYVAQDRRSKNKVAIKEYFPDSTAGRSAGTLKVTAYNGNRQMDYEYGLEGFINEAKVLAALKKVPNIVDIYNCFKENGTAYFSMEYIEGISLKERLREVGGRMPWQEAARILLPVMEALAAVHKEGLIHRDVAPDNIYITGDGGVKLLDFGAARYSLGNQTQTLDVILKRGYAPMEQYAKRARQGPYTDVYSMAACFYAAVTGSIPPEAIERIDEDRLMAVSSLGVHMPRDLENAIYKALEVQAADRYQTMEAFGAAVKAAIEETEKAEKKERKEKVEKKEKPEEKKALAETPAKNSEPAAAAGGGVKDLVARLAAVPKGVKLGVGIGVPALALGLTLLLVIPKLGDDSSVNSNTTVADTTLPGDVVLDSVQSEGTLPEETPTEPADETEPGVKWNEDRSEKSEFDESGNLVRATAFYSQDVIKSVTEYGADGGYKVSVYNANGKPGAVTEYAYGGIKSRVTYKNPDGEETFVEEYDGNGRLNGDPMAARVEWNADNTVKSEYDSADNLVRRTRFRDLSTVVTVNDYNPDGSHVYVSFNSSGARYVSYYNASDKRTRSISYNSDGTIDYIYDYNSNEQYSGYVKYTSKGTLDFVNTYDAGGNLISSTYYNEDGSVRSEE